MASSLHYTLPRAVKAVKTRWSALGEGGGDGFVYFLYRITPRATGQVSRADPPDSFTLYPFETEAVERNNFLV